MKRIWCRFALALGLPLGALGAQERPARAVRGRVRVMVPKPGCIFPETPSCYRTVVGSLEALDSATIVVRRENGDTVKVSRAHGIRLDVSSGRGACSRDRGTCIGLGVVGGAALGAAVGFLSVQSHGGAGSGTSCNENLCELVYLFTVPAGAVVGMIVGAVVGGEHWERRGLRTPERGARRLGRRASRTDAAVLSGRQGCPTVPPTAPDFTPGGINPIEPTPL